VQIVGFIICISSTIARHRNENSVLHSENLTLGRMNGLSNQQKNLHFSSTWLILMTSSSQVHPVSLFVKTYTCFVLLLTVPQRSKQK